MTRRKGSKKDYYLTLHRLYEEEGMPPAPTRDMIRWARRKGFQEPPEVDVEGIQAREMSSALRDEMAPDPQGRSVRKNHCYRHEVQAPDGGVVQKDFWGDFQTLTHEQVHLSFQQRRHGVFSDCRQLKTDADSFNDNENKREPIQLCFDFTEDLAESEQPSEYADVEV